MKGMIFDIKRFAVHDGPGIRTSVFLKGCPLSCTWCHNPEGISSGVELWFNEKRCMHSGKCVPVCDFKALQARKDESPFIHIDRERCQLSHACTQACPTGALEIVGREMSSDELIAELEKDQLFYDVSGGGMTLTGGEPLFQSDFCLELLKKAKGRGISTTLETCLYASQAVLESVIPHVDHFLVDIKIWDAQKHRQYTGRDNASILENFRILAGLHEQITVRIPLIKDITDTPGNLEAIKNFVMSVNPNIPIEKLDYNPLTPSKYKKLGKSFHAVGR